MNKHGAPEPTLAQLRETMAMYITMLRGGPGLTSGELKSLRTDLDHRFSELERYNRSRQATSLTRFLHDTR